MEVRQNHYKVAIIGGGISGLYAAMKLKQDKKFKDEDIIILEKNDRWGGRLATDIVHVGTGNHKPMIKEVEGPMRFTRRNMPMLRKLIDDLKIEDDVIPFLMQPHGKLNNNTRYYRGRQFTKWYADQNPNIWYQMFSLEEKERFKSADDIVKDIYRKLLDHNKSKIVSRFPIKTADIILKQDDNAALQKCQDPEYWSFFRNEFSWPVGLQEVNLRNFSMQALLTEMNYSHGCCMMLVQTQGFLCLSLSAGNVGCVLQDLITFDLIEQQLHQFKRGWSFLVKHVKEKIEKQVHMRKNHEVTKIKQHSNMMFTLHVRIIDDNESPALEKTYTAENVILALPSKAVERLCPIILEGETGEIETRNLKKKMEKFCSSVVGIHCTKINLYFDRDWWNERLNKKLYGPNVTSLPCAFVYPFYGTCHCESKCDGNCDCCDDNNMTDSVRPCVAALTIYCDVNNAQFWSSLQLLGHKFESTLQNEHRHDNLTPASEPVVSEAIRQLKKIFNRDEIPAPILTSFRSWDAKRKEASKRKEEYGYALHMWGMGVDDRHLREEIIQPYKNLYMCNESWSDYQGWVEGSLRSTHNVIQEMTEQVNEAYESE